MTSLSLIHNSRDGSPQVRTISSVSLEPIRIKIPFLQERLQAKSNQERKEMNQNLNEILNQNNQNIKSKRFKDMIEIKKRRTQELINLKKSMCDGQPKHPRVFSKMNQVLETFQNPVYLYPKSLQEVNLLLYGRKIYFSFEKAKEYQAADIAAKKEKFAYLRAKVAQNLDEPWNPTQYVSDYFDNMNLMKSPKEFKQISELALTSSQTFHPRKNKYVEASSSPRSEKTVKSEKNLSSKHGSATNQEQPKHKNIFHLNEGVKPTSGNNLVLFQKQLSSQKALSQQNNLSNSSRQIKSQVYFNSTYKNFNSTSREWINAYHEKETFNKILSDNIYVKVNEDRIHFKPFRPTNTQGYVLNKYISLEAGEREFKNKKSDFFENLEQESFEIKPPKRKSTSLKRAQD